MSMKTFSIFQPCWLISVFFFVRNAVLINSSPPSFVFRADFRGPNDIFENGMPSLGDNNNLIDHVDGRSCHYGVANSAFVATTREESFARQWAADRLWITDTASSVYVYKIRATANFYGAYESLMHAFDQTHNDHYRSRAGKYQHQQEWLAHNGIPREQVVEVTEYQRDTANPGNLIRVGNVQQNHRYDATVSTRGNDNPYPTGMINSDDVYAVPSRLTRLLTACFAVCRRHSSSKRSISNDAKTCPQMFKVSLSTPMSTVWDPVLKRLVQRIVPWVEHKNGNENNHFIQRPSNCLIDPGVKHDSALLEVSCARNKFYQNFVVLLSAGESTITRVDLIYSDGKTGVIWKRWSTEIPVVGTVRHTLDDYDYTINTVFTGRGWWSKIKVYPIYPVIKKKMIKIDVCS